MSITAAGLRPVYSVRTGVYLASVVITVAVAVVHLRSYWGSARNAAADAPAMPDMPEMHHTAAPLAVSWGWWVLMAAAMMLPVIAVSVERVAAASLWRRRYVAAVEYIAGFLGVWALFGLTVLGMVAAVWPRGAPVAATAFTLVAAAVWQVTPARKRALRRCARPAFVALRGWRADRDCLFGGVARGARCVLTCAPVMAVMALSHSVILMLALTALLLTERAAGPNPTRRAGRPHEAIALLGLAGSVVAWAALGTGFAA
jgi:predicted metal-binding membrane protein